MYTPPHFEITDTKEALSFIQAHSFGQLISMVEGRLFVTHIPFILSDDGDALICHVAKKNPQWQLIEQQEVLITFQGEHDYVSPSWLESASVPTWNYQAVHVYGKPVLITKHQALKSIVDDMTRINEAPMETPWQPEYQDALLNAIVGIEIKINDIQCKYKLSQNKSAGDQARIAEALSENGLTELSKVMKKNDQ